MQVTSKNIFNKNFLLSILEAGHGIVQGAAISDQIDELKRKKEEQENQIKEQAARIQQLENKYRQLLLMVNIF